MLDLRREPHAVGLREFVLKRVKIHLRRLAGVHLRLILIGPITQSAPTIIASWNDSGSPVSG